MKKLQNLLLLSLFLLATSTLAQHKIPKNPNTIDKNGLKQGKWTILYDANWEIIKDSNKTKFYRIIAYKDNKPVGKVVDYYKYPPDEPRLSMFLKFS